MIKMLCWLKILNVHQCQFAWLLKVLKFLFLFVMGYKAGREISFDKIKCLMIMGQIG